MDHVSLFGLSDLGFALRLDHCLWNLEFYSWNYLCEVWAVWVLPVNMSVRLRTLNFLVPHGTCLSVRLQTLNFLMPYGSCLSVRWWTFNFLVPYGPCLSMRWWTLNFWDVRILPAYPDERFSATLSVWISAFLCESNHKLCMSWRPVIFQTILSSCFEQRLTTMLNKQSENGLVY